MKFEETSFRAIRNAKRRKWTVVAGVSLLLLSILSGALYLRYQHSNNSRITQEFIKAEDVNFSEQRLFREKFDKASEQEKLELVKKSPDNSKSIPLYEKVFNENPRHPVGIQAGLKLSTILINNERWEEASKALETLSVSTLSQRLTQILVRRALAGVYARNNNLDKALEQLNILIKIPDNPFKADHQLFLAELSYVKGQIKESGELLKSLAQSRDIESPNNSSIKEKAQLWLSYWGL